MKSNLLIGMSLVLALASLGSTAGAGTASTDAPSLNNSASGPSHASSPPLKMVIEFEPITATSNGYLIAFNLEPKMAKAIGQPVKVISNPSMRKIAIDTRSGNFDALWVPSNLAISAIKDPRYEMIGFDGHMSRYALVALRNAADFSAVKGGSLYLPQEDSSAGAVGIAMLSDHGIRLADFRSVFTTGNYAVAQFTLEQSATSVTSLPEEVVKDWLIRHPTGGKVLDVSAPVPGQTLVVLKSLSAVTKKQLSEWFAQQANVTALTPITPAAFKYITGLSHYTPEVMPGIQKVTAAEVVNLVKAGAQIVDVRTTAEFGAKHIPAATLLPYIETSPRFVGADISKDVFDVSKLPSASGLVLYCNGPECWKSYKASLFAIGSKRYTKVYWFRAGLPEWERSGFEIARK